MRQLFTDFKKTYDSVRRELLYNILIEIGIPMKMVGLIKMCLRETFSRVRVGKHLSDMFPIKNCLKKGHVLSPLFFNFVSAYEGSGKSGWLEIKWHISASGLC